MGQQGESLDEGEEGHPLDATMDVPDHEFTIAQDNQFAIENKNRHEHYPSCKQTDGAFLTEITAIRGRGFMIIMQCQ